MSQPPVADFYKVHLYHYLAGWLKSRLVPNALRSPLLVSNVLRSLPPPQPLIRGAQPAASRFPAMPGCGFQPQRGGLAQIAPCPQRVMHAELLRLPAPV